MTLQNLCRGDRHAVTPASNLVGCHKVSGLRILDADQQFGRWSDVLSPLRRSKNRQGCRCRFIQRFPGHFDRVADAAFALKTDDTRPNRYEVSA